MSHICDGTHDIICSEPLEARWFLSSVKPVDPGQVPLIMPNGRGLHLVEIALAAEDAEGVSLDPAKLPEQVLGALRKTYPDAQILAAKFEEEDGVREFGVTARFNGQLLDLTLAGNGEILETEQAVATAGLPSAVLDWVRAQFPGASIGESAVVAEDGAVSYEILIRATGGVEYEAVLRVDGAGGEGQPPEHLVIAARETAPFAMDRATAFSSTEVAGEDVAIDDSVVTAIPGGASDEQPVPLGDHSATVIDAAAEKAGGGLLIPAMPIVIDATQAIAATTQMPALIPQAAGLLSEMIPLDLSSVERRLADVLDQVESLAAKAAGDEPEGAGVRIAALAGLFVGLHLLLIESRARGGTMQRWLMRATRIAGRTGAGRGGSRRSWFLFW